MLSELRDKTEASWTRARRAAVAKAARWRSLASAKKRALDGCGDMITDKLLKEAHFQCDKAKKAKLQAIADNHILSSEIAPGEQHPADAMTAHQLKLDLARERQKLRTAKVLAREPVFNLRGAHCFIASDVGDCTGPIAKHGLMHDHERLDASIFVVSDPSKPGQRIAWLAALKGLRFVTPIYLESGGRKGACLKYHPLWLTLETYT